MLKQRRNFRTGTERHANRFTTEGSQSMSTINHQELHPSSFPRCQQALHSSETAQPAN